MKNSIVPAVVCCLIFAAYVVGQNQPKEKPVAPCCCKHQQQIANDLHWIRTQLEKPYKAPPDINFDLSPIDSGKLPPMKIEEPNFKFPKTPPKKR